MEIQVLISSKDTDLVLKETENGVSKFTLFEKMSDLVNACNERHIVVTPNDFVEVW